MTAAPALSPSAKRPNPSTESNIALLNANIGRPPEIGVTSVVRTFICTMPPAGAISSGMRIVKSIPNAAVTADAPNATTRTASARTLTRFADISSSPSSCESESFDAGLGNRTIVLIEGHHLPQQRFRRNDLRAHRAGDFRRCPGHRRGPELAAINFHHTDAILKRPGDRGPFEPFRNLYLI